MLRPVSLPRTCTLGSAMMTGFACVGQKGGQAGSGLRRAGTRPCTHQFGRALCSRQALGYNGHAAARFAQLNGRKVVQCGGGHGESRGLEWWHASGVWRWLRQLSPPPACRRSGRVMDWAKASVPCRQTWLVAFRTLAPMPQGRRPQTNPGGRPAGISEARFGRVAIGARKGDMMAPRSRFRLSPAGRGDHKSSLPCCFFSTGAALNIAGFTFGITGRLPANSSASVMIWMRGTGVPVPGS